MEKTVIVRFSFGLHRCVGLLFIFILIFAKEAAVKAPSVKLGLTKVKINRVPVWNLL